MAALTVLNDEYAAAPTLTKYERLKAVCTLAGAASYAAGGSADDAATKIPHGATFYRPTGTFACDNGTHYTFYDAANSKWIIKAIADETEPADTTDTSAAGYRTRVPIEYDR